MSATAACALSLMVAKGISSRSAPTSTTRGTRGRFPRRRWQVDLLRTVDTASVLRLSSRQPLRTKEEPCTQGRFRLPLHLYPSGPRRFERWRTPFPAQRSHAKDSAGFRGRGCQHSPHSAPLLHQQFCGAMRFAGAARVPRSSFQRHWRQCSHPRPSRARPTCPANVIDGTWPPRRFRESSPCSSSIQRKSA
jgi:hypothetical protein